jgi:hypothetical protein
MSPGNGRGCLRVKPRLRVGLDSPLFPGFAARLRKLGALDQLDEHDAHKVAGIIICDLVTVGPHGWTALQQRAANVGAGCIRPWHDRRAASRALGKAAAALNFGDTIGYVNEPAKE